MRSNNSWLTTKATPAKALLLLFAVFACACSDSEKFDAADGNTDVVADENPVIRERVTVSGVSSGGYMAVQTHIALADRVSGAAIVAGGPYHCAEGSVAIALGRCMSGESLDVSQLVSFTHVASASGNIAATEFLGDAKVWIFHGAKDAVVSSAVAVALADFYREFMPARQIKIVDDIETVHGWPTSDTGNDCLTMGGDFINACGFDTAGNLLGHLYGNLNPPNTNTVSGELRTMNFSAYFEPASGVSDTGFLYVPDNCENMDASCRLHIAFHGCRQGAEFVSDRFATGSGLNEWAAQNRIIVAYPQIESMLMNPQGCWDWWGYSGPQYDLQAGKQISGIAAIIGAFTDGQLNQ